MTLPTGQISFDNINIELEIASGTQISLNDAAVRGLAEVPTGAIAMTDLQGKSNAQFLTASGGTETTVGDYKVHVFNSSGTFTVNAVGNPAGSDAVDYVVVAGGGGGGGQGQGRLTGGGGGAGGYRESNPAPGTEWTGSPLANPGGAVPVSVTSYPISIGSGGAATSGQDNRGCRGTASTFSTVTSAGGGGGGTGQINAASGCSGGSGGGAGHSWPYYPMPGGGGGNSPPVSPPQGQSGGNACRKPGTACPQFTRCYAMIGGGGGGATQTGHTGPWPSPQNANICGGAGANSQISGSPQTLAGGGGGGGSCNNNSGGSGGGGRGGSINQQSSRASAGTANTGGGGGGQGCCWSPQPLNKPGAGGSGKVILRYKFQ